MSKYFGTDGIRGVANQALTVEMALKVGQYLGWVNKGQKILVGQDTRLSGPMLSQALAAGAASSGCDVYVLGVCATPCVSYLVEKEGFAGAVMISASHNPFQDNGLKCFASDGTKISDALQDEIEAYIDGLVTLDRADSESIGRIVEYSQGLSVYLEYVESIVTTPLHGLKVVLDNANGSAVSSSKQAFEDLGAKVQLMHSSPDGININTNCGSTHPESLQEEVVRLCFDVGFAFDGDADRCMAVDHEGNLVDGDGILYILGQFLREKGLLHNDTIVSTVMANLGFVKACERLGFKLITTQVGDKYVFASMDESHASLGGEQSGHIILKELMRTGDGVLVALLLAEVMVEKKASLQELLEGFESFPQILENIRVKNKHEVMSAQGVLEAEERIAETLGNDGRILVRASGTEELVRVMVEAKTSELCRMHVNDMIEVIQTIE